MCTTLVLDSYFTPQRQISWQTAIKLIVQERAEILAVYDDWQVSSPSVTFDVPSVIRLFRNVSLRRKLPRFSRSNIYIRDKGQCQYCGIRLSHGDATYDHVLPKSRGGETDWHNIVIACCECNKRKGNKTPEEAKMRLRQRPVRPTKLQDIYRVQVSWNPSMPQAWRHFLRDSSYWHGEIQK